MQTVGPVERDCGIVPFMVRCEIIVKIFAVVVLVVLNGTMVGGLLVVLWMEPATWPVIVIGLVFLLLCNLDGRAVALGGRGARVWWQYEDELEEWERVHGTKEPR